MGVPAGIWFDMCEFTCHGCTDSPTVSPTITPTSSPSTSPSTSPSMSPTTTPTESPTLSPSTEGTTIAMTLSFTGDLDSMTPTQVRALEAFVLAKINTTVVVDLAVFGLGSDLNMDFVELALYSGSITAVIRFLPGSGMGAAESNALMSFLNSNPLTIALQNPDGTTTFLTSTGVSTGQYSSCPAGFFRDDSATSYVANCTLCPHGTFIAEQDHVQTECTPWVRCGENEFVWGGSKFEDRNCSECAPGRYVEALDHEYPFCFDCGTITEKIPENHTCFSAPQPSNKKIDADTIVASSAGAFIIILVVVLIVYGIRGHNSGVRSVEDMALVDAQIRGDLDLLEGTMVELGDAEIALDVEGDLDVFASATSDELVHMIQRILSRALGDISGVIISSASVDTDAGVFLLTIGSARKDLNPDVFASALQSSLRRTPMSMWLENHPTEIVKVKTGALTIPLLEALEVPASRVKKIGLLGVGSFADVYSGVLRSDDKLETPTPVALKIQTRTGSLASRAIILREAALLNLLNHPNLLRLEGVCSKRHRTTLITQLCENGCLQDLLRAMAKPDCDEPLKLSTQLNFCADVASGLTYLANRGIIHRDVRSHNILLDANNSCVISGFSIGQARYHEGYFAQSPSLRWFSREVLADCAYSPQSDVYAFGCLMHEIFSLGTEPYDTLPTPAEVVDHVKGGRFMQRHELCPIEIYDSLLSPCWQFSVADRPTFFELLQTIVRQSGGTGALSKTTGSLALMQSGTGSEWSTFRSFMGEASTESVEDSPPSSQQLMAPSVHHMLTAFRGGVASAVQGALDDPNQRARVPGTIEETPIWNALELFANPISVNATCPRDNTAGCAYVDTISGEGDIGAATVVVSYSASDNIFNLIDALQQWADRTGRDPKSTYVWIAGLCLNQHRRRPIQSTRLLNAEIAPRLKAVGTLLPFLDPAIEPKFLSQAWCFFELYIAITLQCKVEILVTDDQQNHLHSFVEQNGPAAVERTLLDKISSEGASAEVPAELASIQKVISSTIGFNRLDEEIRKMLRREWKQEEPEKPQYALPALVSAPKLQLSGDGGAEPQNDVPRRPSSELARPPRAPLPSRVNGSSMPRISRESISNPFAKRPSSTSLPRRDSATRIGIPHREVPRMSMDRSDPFIGRRDSASSQSRMSIDTGSRSDPFGGTSGSSGSRSGAAPPLPTGDPFGRRTGRRGSQAAAADPFARAPNTALRRQLGDAAVGGAGPRPRPPRPHRASNTVFPLPLPSDMPMPSLSQSSVSVGQPKAGTVKSNKVAPFVPPTPEAQPAAVDVASTHSEPTAPVITRVAAAGEEERQPAQAPMPSAVAEDKEYIELGPEPTDEYIELGPEPTDEYIELGPELTKTDGVNQLETIDLSTAKPELEETEKEIPELRDEAELDDNATRGSVAEEFPFLGEMLAEMSKGVDSDDNDEDIDYPAPAPPRPDSATAWG